MRTLFLSLLCLFGALTVLQAQDPGIAYQAVARDADGDPLADAELDVRVTLYGADDAILWQESHASVLTNQFGNLALTIGDGAVTPGYDALSALDWSASGLHFGIEVDAGSGYASFGSVDVEAVPVAMYALNGQEEEIAALQGALDALDGDVDTFVDDLYAAIAANASADATESAEGDDADDALQANIDDEAEARAAADNTLQGNIDDEAEARAAADNTLQSNIDDEADARADADSDEAEARAAADNTLQGNIDDEAEARADADAAEAEARAAQDAILLGLIEDNDGDISVLQTGVNDNTMDIADLMSVISIDESGITVNDLTISGDLNFPGVFSAATGLFNYLSANNADFEDMIAEAAQVEQLIFFEGRALGDQSSLDVDGVFNVDGQSTMGGDLAVAGTISSQGSFLATEAYVNSGDATIQEDVNQNEADSDSADEALAEDLADEVQARQDADALLQGSIDAAASASAAYDAAQDSAAFAALLEVNAALEDIQDDVNQNEEDSDDADSALQGNIDDLQDDVDQNEEDSDSADEALAEDLADEAQARQDADALLQGNIEAAASASAAYDAAQDSAAFAALLEVNGALEDIQEDVDQNEEDGDSADEAMASEIEDNEFRIAAAAADMGFVTSTVGSVNNVPLHPGYAGADHIAADANSVAADMALDAAISDNSEATADLQEEVDANEASSNFADSTLQANIDALSAAMITADGILQSNITAEAITRAAADSTEAAQRAAADNTLQGNIDDEAEARAAADLAEAGARAAADSTETAQRIAADNTLQGNIDANMQADTAQANADAAARALIQGDVDQNESDSDSADQTLQGNIDANMQADTAQANADAAARAVIQGDVDQNEEDSDSADQTLQGNIDANMQADTAQANADAAARAVIQGDVDQNEEDSDSADQTLQNNINDEAEARADADAAEAGARAAADSTETAQRIAADGALEEMIESNAGDITSLQDGLQSEILARSFGDAVNANAINANTALIALEEDARIDGDSSLAAYDAYLESLILNTAGSVLDVENIIETVDYFDDNGSATINLEGGWTLVDFGTAQIQASTSSFDAVDAQHIDTDDIDVQTIEVESNLVSPAGTIGNLDATTLEVYTTLDVSGETTLGANLSVTGNVTAADATAANHLASFGQLTTAADSLQENIEDEAEARATADSTETAQRIAADNTLQGNIDANMQADTAQANADAAARAVIQGDVDQNEEDSDSADQTLQNNINDEAATRAAADSTETAQRIAADDLLNDRADSLATAVSGNDSDILTNSGNITTNANGVSDNALAISNEVTRATNREDSIISVLYWNLTGDELTLDAEIASVELGETDLDIDALTANFIGAQDVFTSDLDADEAEIDDLQADDIIAGDIHAGELDASELEFTEATGDTLTVTSGITADLTGNASTATALETARNFSASGDATAPAVSFDGTGNVDLELSLSDDSVDSAEIADDAVGSSEIASNAVDSDEIATDAVGSSEIATNAVDSDEIAADAVGSSEIATNAVDSDEIAADAVGSSEIATGAVDSDEIATSAVGSDEIENGSVANADLANDGLVLGDTDMSLGTITTTVTGLTSVESASFSGNLSGNVSGQVSDISNHDTDALSEGATNLYYTDGRARAALSATQTGGDGTFTYDDATGAMTYTGPSEAEVVDHFEAGTGVSISATGEIAIGQAVATTDDVTFNSVTTTANASVGGNATVTGTLDAGASTLASATITGSASVGGAATVTGHTELDGGLNVDGATTMDALTADGEVIFNNANTTFNTTDFKVAGGLVDIDANDVTVDGHNLDVSTTGPIDMSSPEMNFNTSDFDVNGPADVSGTLNVDGATTMAALTADGAADLQAGLNVDGATTMDETTMAGNLTQTGDHLLTGNSDISGDIDVDGTSNLDNTDIDGTLNVQEDATFQEDVNVEDNVAINTAGNAGTVLTINDAAGNSAVTVTTSITNVVTNETATTMVVPSLVVQESANYTGDMQIGGSLSVTDNVTAAAAPTVGSHLTNKDYVDAQITTAITAPELFSYDAVASAHASDVIYYINGDLLLYQTGMSTGPNGANYNYTIELSGSNLDQITGGKLRARGNSQDLTDATHGWAYDQNDDVIRFYIDYNAVSALAGAQVDGYVSCSLTFSYGNAGAEKNSGLTLRFYLDSANPVATANTFNE